MSNNTATKLEMINTFIDAGLITPREGSKLFNIKASRYKMWRYGNSLEITRRQKRICYFKHFDPKTCHMKPRSFYKLVDHMCWNRARKEDVLAAAVDYVKNIDYKNDFEDLLK